MYTKKLKDKILEMAMRGELFKDIKPNKILILGNIANISRGGSPRPIKEYLTNSNKGINWIKIGDSSPESKYIDFSNEKIKSCGLSKTRLVKKGDLLLSNSMSFGRPFILNIDGAIHDGWLVISEFNEYFTTDFMYYALSSKFVYNQFLKLASGTTVKNLNKEKVARIEIPFFELSEQQRIVAKIEELFAEIDTLELEQEKLKNLTAKLDSKILEMAMKGELVPQDRSEESAEILLAKIKAEKQQLIAEKKIKKEKSLPEITEEEKPYELPEGWVWCRLGDIGKQIFAGGDKPNNVSLEKTDFYKYPIYSNGITNKGLYGYTDVAKVKEKAITISARGTIGYTEVREGNFTPIVRLICVIPFKDICINYLKYFLSKNINYGEGTSIKQLTVPNIITTIIPLPPLKEQQRIVAKIEELKKEIDNLRIKS